MNKKLYIVLNNKAVSKGKLARAAATIGQYNPHMRFSSAVVVKGDDLYNDLLEFYSNPLGFGAPGVVFIGKKSGEHRDAGKTQCLAGTSLAFGVICKKDQKLDLKMY